MKVGEQRGHLLLGEAAGKAGHHSVPCQNISPDSRIGGWNSAGQGSAVKDAVQVWRNLLEDQIVVFVAVRAANLVEVLPFSLLRSQRRRRVAASQKGHRQTNRRACAEF